MFFTYTHNKISAVCFIFLFILLGIHFTANAQDNNPKDNNDALQKIEAVKKAYLTRQLDLNPQEAEKFWPLYNQYQKEMHSVIKERRQNHMNKNQLNKADNEQIEETMNRDFQLEQQALQIRQKYRKEFQEVLPPRKVMKVYRSEKDFNMKLIEELHRRQNKGLDNDGPKRRQRQPALQPVREQTPVNTAPKRRFNRPAKSNGSRPSGSEG